MSKINEIILDYKSPPIYIGYEYCDEDQDDKCFKITNIINVEVYGAETKVQYECEEISL